MGVSGCLFGRFYIATVIHWSFLYSAIFRFRADALRSSCRRLWTESAMLNNHQSGVLTALLSCYMAGATWNCCLLGAHSVYTVQPRTSFTVLFEATYLGCMCICWSPLYSAILRSQSDSVHSNVILHEWLAFNSAFLNIHRSGVLTALTWNCCRLGAFCVHHTTMRQVTWRKAISVRWMGV